MYKFNYRWVINEASVAAAALVAIGYAPPGASNGSAAAQAYTKHYTSLGQAISAAMAWNRRYQRDAIDTKVTVYGTIVDDTTNGLAAAPADGAAQYTLTGGDKAEQTFAVIDTPDLEATEKINAANRLPTNGGAFDTGFPSEDVT